MRPFAANHFTFHYQPRHPHNYFTMQLGTSCSFDSPGLARNEPTPGERSQGDSTPSVLRFFCEGMVSMRGLIGSYANISMNTSAIANVATMQRYGCYTNIPMNVFAIANVTTTQRCKRCTYDSPGLASESEVYPGSFAVRGNNAVGVVPFIYWYFIEAFHAENVQHLRR